MKFTLISDKGEGLGLAAHLSSEGHSVTLVMDGNGSSLGNGIVDRRSMVDQSSDIVILDSEKYGSEADDLRANGKRVLGPSRWSQALQYDIEYAQKVIKLAGWKTGSLSRGINLYITAWFNGTRFISSYTSIVYRRMMSSGCGPDVECTGLLGNFQQPVSRVSETFLRPLEKILRKVNHRGCFNIHTVVDQDQYVVKTINASFNSPLALLLFENTKPSTADLILRLFDESSNPIQPLEQWAAGLLVTVPPYPYDVPAESIVLEGLEAPALKHLWLVDMMHEAGSWRTAGTTGKIGYITARGSDGTKTVRSRDGSSREKLVPGYTEAMQRIYRTVKRLRVNDLQFRDDVGRNVDKLVKELRSNQWMK